jgi:hypothetical protein
VFADHASASIPLWERSIGTSHMLQTFTREL